MSNTQRVVLVVLAGVVIVGSLVLFTPEDDDSRKSATQASEPAPPEPGPTATAKPGPARPPAPTIQVRGGKLVGPPRTIKATNGETIRLIVESDTPQEVHVHGYDLLGDAAPGRPARFKFRADLEGAFEIELHATAEQIAKLEVRPG